MKKLLLICLITVFLGIPLTAQESADPRAALAAAAAAEGMVIPGQVTTPLGKITLHGMFIGGLSLNYRDNTARGNAGKFPMNPTTDDDEDKFVFLPYDATWQENAAKISLVYDNGKYGAYFMLAAEDWDGNVENNYKTIGFPYALVWRSFFDNKLKFTLGKLYAEDFQTQDRIWKTEGAANGGWQFSDSNNNMALRAEFKPIEGLNVGFQWDFNPKDQAQTPTGVPFFIDSLKEIGIAAEYKSDLFNALVGARFDGPDGMNKFDFYGYLDDYYGGWGYIGNPVQQDSDAPSPIGGMAPNFKYGDEVYGKVYGQGNSFNIGSIFSTANANKPFEGSHRLMLGFNFKGVRNLTAKMQAGFWNLGDFDRFGAGEIDETIRYQITPKLNAGVILYQQFYGSDVFPDNMINSPYFRFEPVAAYKITPNIEASLTGTYGICNDVVDSDWRIKPSIAFTLGGFGAFRMELSYEFKSTTYTDEAIASMPMILNMMKLGGGAEGGKAINTSLIGLSVMWMF
jgi:hypothetical protein